MDINKGTSMENDFKTAKTASQFSYQRSPHHDSSFMILKHTHDNGYQPVGDYTALDLKENAFFSEKKVMNIVSLLNKNDDILDLSEESDGTQLFYYEAPHNDETKRKIIFYTQNGTGVSQENALFLINKEVWNHA